MGSARRRTSTHRASVCSRRTSAPASSPPGSSSGAPAASPSSTSIQVTSDPEARGGGRGARIPRPDDDVRAVAVSRHRRDVGGLRAWSERSRSARPRPAAPPARGAGPVRLDVSDGTSGGRSSSPRVSARAVRLEGCAGTAVTSRENTRRFYEELAVWAAENGWLRLSFLRVGEQAVAFQYGFEAGGTYYFLKEATTPSTVASLPASFSFALSWSAPSRPA